MTDFLMLAFVLLLAGVISVPIASRLGLGSVLGYLIAGIAIGPILRWLHVDVISIQHFAEFGVVMMLFLVGLELEPKKLWSMRTRLIGLGGGQVGLTTMLVMACALFFGQPWSIALAIGLVCALSSTAIVLQTLTEKGLMKSDAGQASFSVLLFQDIAVIPMLAFIPLLAIPELAEVATQTASHGGDGGDHGQDQLSLVSGLNLWQTTGVTIGAIAVVILGGNYLTGPIFRFIAATNLRELFTAAALMIVIGIALLMSLVGLSPALGTFLAGVVLANSEYRHELEADINPFKGLLLGLFFMTVGAGINFALLSDSFAVIIGMTVGLMVIKGLVLLALARIFNIDGGDKWLFALGLSQAGEFGFVLLSFTVANAVIPTQIADQLLLVVALSMLLTPLLFMAYERLIRPRYNQSLNREADKIDEDSDIIIAGLGRVGGLVNRMLSAAGHSPTVIDFSAKQLDMMGTFGFQAYFGDATRPDLLDSAGIEDAKLLIITIDGKDQITQMVEYVTHTYPDLHVIARAMDRNHVYDLYAAGCRDIIRETYDSALRIGRSAFEALGASRDQASDIRDAFNEMDKAAMIEAASHYDPAIPPHENEAFVAKIVGMQEDWNKQLGDKIADILNAPKS